MMLQMLAVFAEFEHATIIDRITAGIERRAKQGYWHGRVPFGYRRDTDKQLVPDERTAPTVRRIFQLYTGSRLGAAAIARRLAVEQAPSPPRGWQPNVVLLILHNDAYTGRIHWHGETLDGLHEPLVDEVTFARAQRLLDGRRGDFAARRANTSEFLLSGLVRCGRCRRAYVGVSANGNGGAYHYHYYACSGRQKLGRGICEGQRINRDTLENAVLSQLTDIYQDGTLIQQAIEHLTARQDQDRAALLEQRAVLTKEIQQAARALDRYHQASRAASSASSEPPSACPASTPASIRYATKTSISPMTSPQERPQRPTRKNSPPSPNTSTRPSPEATHNSKGPATTPDRRPQGQQPPRDPPDIESLTPQRFVYRQEK
jgi:site-specific DNA recombinase